MRNSVSSKGKFVTVLAHAGALLASIVWGTSFLSTKVLMDQGGLSPIEVFVYRFGLAYLILLLFTFRKLISDSWKDEVTFLLCGMCAGSLYFITENYALKLTATGNVSLLASISPIFTTLLMAVFYNQRIKPGAIIGSVIAFGGVGCIIFSHGASLEIRPAGDLLALSAAMCWAVYSVAVKRVLPLYSGFFVTRKLFFYGVVSALPFLLLQGGPWHLKEVFDLAHPGYFLNLMFLVCVCSLAAYLVWNEVLKILGPVTANNYNYLQPLVTMIAAYLLLGENIYLLGYLGCALIVGGLVYSDKCPDGRMHFRK